MKQEDANCMDPQIRLLHETCYEAIVDAGMDPNELRGKRIGVFIGHCYDDTDSAYREDASKAPAFKQLAASRVSYAFDFTGPVSCTDTACASSFTAFFKAVSAMRSGDADAALVCGCAIHLRPFTAVAFHNLKMLSDDGRSKCMDANADGYCRSEAVVSVLLQRKSQAKRIYSTVLNTRTNTDGFKPEGITFPSYSAQRRLMLETYSEAGVDPRQVEYMEAHMTGTPAGDPVESAAIVDVFCPEDRKMGPLLMGCLKSNMGHTEGASGTCAITKACLVFQRRELPPNLHLNTPNPHIEGLKNGTLKPVLERMPFNGSLIGVNSFGFGGCNVHAVLQANEKNQTEEDFDILGSSLPYRMVHLCGRTKDVVEEMFQNLKSNRKKVTRGFLALLNDYSKTSVSSGMYARGSCLYDKDLNIVSSQVHSIKEKKPLWLVFSALGCQWPAMAKELMLIEPFAQSINKSIELVKKHSLGVDLQKLLLDESASMDDLISTFLSIVSVQIALVDTLYYLHLEPEGIVGHSVGEIAAGYADGCMNHEETILVAYTIAKIAIEKTSKKGAMAAVGLSWEKMEEKLSQMDKKLQDEVFIGCNNSQDTITLSGWSDSVEKAMESLKKEDIMVRDIDCCGIPFHSPLVLNTYEPMKEQLSKILTSPKNRSSKWLSTSVPEEKWHEEEFRVLGPSYYPNSMISPVKFAEVFQYMPKDAVVVEVGPHAMLLSLLKRGLGPDASCIPLMRKKESTNGNGKTADNLQMVLSAVGSVYSRGHAPAIEKLYPKVEYPVPRETASISPLIKWDHSKDLMITKFPDYFNVLKGDQVASFDLMEPKAQFLAGHCIDGRTLFPATGYLWIIWQRFAMSCGINSFEECAVEFFNVKFHRATMLPKTGMTSFTIRHMPSSGSFTITEGGSVCVTGFAKIPENASCDEISSMINPPVNEEAVTLSTKELYKEFRVRGYDYGPSFQGLVEASSDGTRGKIKWLGNWVSFTDSMLQLAILGKKERGLFIPTFIEYMKCDVKTLLNEVKACKNEMGESILEARFDKEISAGCSTGIAIKGLRASPAPRRSVQTATVESYQFVPYIEANIDKPINASEIDKLDKYVNYCQRMVRIVQTNNTNGLREAIETDDGLKILLESGDDKVILAKTLWEVIHARDEDKSIVLTDVLRDSMVKTASQLPSDTLLRTVLTSEKLLRTQIDVVMENFPAKKINVTEALQTVPLCNELYELIEASSVNIANYRILHPDHEAIGTKYGTQSSALPTHVPANLEADLFVYSDLSTRFVASPVKEVSTEFEVETFLASVANSLKVGSFLLILFRSQVTPVEKNICETISFGEVEKELKSPEYFTEMLSKAGLVVISLKSTTSGYHTMLLRKPVELANQIQPAKSVESSDAQQQQIAPAKKSPVVVEVKLNDYSWVEEMKSHLVDKDEGEGGEQSTAKKERKTYKVWLIAKDSAYSGIIGMVNCLRRELGSERIRSIFCPPEEQSDKLDPSNLITDEIVQRDLVMNVYSDGQYGSFRHYQLDTVETWAETEHTYLDVMTKGDLSSLRWIEADHKHWPNLPSSAKNEKDLLCHIYYASLNFKDIMVATGRIPVDAYPADFMGTGLIGMEFAGKDQHGNRILAFAPSKSIATTLLLPEHNFMWRVPDHWTMAEAATVPVCYVTIYYALFVRGELRPGESILIHAGSGGIGQAAISVCLNIGCTVFTTVGSKAKREFILKEFPQIPESHIGNSRDTSFEEMILRETNGRGVDMVLNSLADDKLQASIRCLADFGRFIEIGKYDIIQNNPLNLSDLGRNKTYHVVCVAHLDFDALINKSESALRLCNKLHGVIQNGIDTGAIRPLKYHVFEKDQAEEAFRFMSTGKHMGKVLIKIRDDDELKALPKPVTINALKQTHFHPLKSYIITGGLGGFGLELADWMISRGATKIILTSRSGAKQPFQQVCIKRFTKDKGASVLVSNNDVSTLEGATALIDEALQLGPIGGIFHLAMVLKDAAVENQSEESFKESCASKVAGTVHLDQLSRSRCQNDLEYFVCFSSVTAGRGNAGQINYGFSNSVMERICEARRKAGFPGLAIQWGAIGDVGVVAESIGGNDIVIGGTVPQRMPSCLNVLDSFLQSDSLTTVSSIVKADKRRTTGGGKGDLLRQVCHILGVKDPSSLDPNTTLGDLGLDSLMAVEIRQALERDYDLVLTAQEVRQLKIKDIQQIGSAKGSSSEKKNQSGSSTDNSAAVSLGITQLTLRPSERMFNFLTNTQSHGGRPIFFLSSAAGDFDILTQLSNQIIRPVIGIYWTSDLDNVTSVTEAAKFFVQQLRATYPDSTYDILGYSFGSLIAYEMALELQCKFGLKAVTKLLLLDGSPVYTKLLHAPYLKFMEIADADQSHLEALLGYVSFHLHGHDLTELRSQLTGLTLKEERIKVTADYLSRVMKREIPAVDLASASERFFHKMRLINSYDQPSKKFVGEIRLLRPTNPGHIGMELANVPADYGLADLVDGTHDVRTIEGDSDSYLISHVEDAGTMIDMHFQYLTFA